MPPFLLPDDLLPLTPAVFHILLALSAGERHGYAIMQDVERLSEGRVKMGPGTLYGSIKRMQEAGLIEESGQRPDPLLDDQRRRYYRLTLYGQGVMAAEARRIERLAEAIRVRRLLPGAEERP
jgi:DNA-binding PadR family transcriptional regulator